MHAPSLEAPAPRAVRHRFQCMIRDAARNAPALPIVLALIVLVAPAAAVPAPRSTQSLLRVADSAETRALISDLGILTESITRHDTRLEIIVDAPQRRALDRLGIASELVIDDLTAFYATRAAARLTTPGWPPPGQGLLDPGFGFGSMGGFYTYDEIRDKLDEMRTDYPGLISERQLLTTTLEGREVWYVRISDHPDIAEDEPAALFTGLTHGNEPMGMACVVYTMFHLLESYATDPEARYLVDNRELYFVPVLNADGYAYNESVAPQGGGTWRKNRRPNGGGIYGVDLNRNFGYLWGHDNQGSSPDPSAWNYRGTGPFSELETSGIRALHLARTIRTSLYYHTFGRYELHPFGYEASAFPPGQELSWYQYYATELCSMNGYSFGNPMQMVGYLTNGDAVDWSYGEQVEKNAVFAFIPEVGSSTDGHWPDPARIVPLAEENLGPNLFWAWTAGGRCLLIAAGGTSEVPRGGVADVLVTLSNTGLGAADDVTVSVTTADPYVVDIHDPPAFPTIPPRTVGDNAVDPNQVTVAGDAPLGHVIALDVTVRQDAFIRAQTQITLTVVEGTTAMVSGTSEAPAARRPALTVSPNPLGTGGWLHTELPAGGRARLDLYDIAGRRVRALLAGELGTGAHRIAIDGRDDDGNALASGVYIVRLETAGGSAAARVVVLH